MTEFLGADSPIATIFGGSGFVGRYVVRRLVRCGWRVRVAVRNPNQAIFLKTYGEVGQVEVFKCSMFDSKAMDLCIPGSTLVINAAAGLLNETSNKMFKNYYIDAPELIAKHCVKFEVKKLIHVSSLGVDKSSSSVYAMSKSKGEDKILEHFSDATIVRPSLIFGHEDRLFNRYASLATYNFVLPIIGQETRFQPIYVDDLALAIEKIAIGNNLSGIYELGGPEILSFREIIERMLVVVRRKRLIVNIPFRLANLMAAVFEWISKLSLGLTPLPFTVDNVRQLKVDNIVSHDKKSFKDLGIRPQNIDTIIPLYLYSYRPHGQYNDITQSADKPN